MASSVGAHAPMTVASKRFVRWRQTAMRHLSMPTRNLIAHLTIWFLMAQPMLCIRLLFAGFPFHEHIQPLPSSLRWPSSEHLVLLGAAISMQHESSRATIPVLHLSVSWGRAGERTPKYKWGPPGTEAPQRKEKQNIKKGNTYLQHDQRRSRNKGRDPHGS